MLDVMCASKRQKPIARGNASGDYGGGEDTPCKGKSMRNVLICSAFALTGRKPSCGCLPRVIPWAISFCLFEACIKDASLLGALP